MKKIYYLAFALLAGAAMTSCSDDDWDTSELYTRMVSLKAPLNDDGVYNVYLRYNENGLDTLQLPVIVSGTTENNANQHIKMGVDNDTLAHMNVERFNDRTDLYYKQLPENFYRFLSDYCDIPSGTSIKNFPIEFKLSGLNMVEKWVLPVTIEEDPSYRINTYKGRGKALLNINMYNDFSGTFSATSMNVYVSGEEGSSPFVEDSRKCYVVDDSTTFFYAGKTWEQGEDRARYRVNMRFLPGTTSADGVTTGNLLLTANDPNNAMNLTVVGTPTYEIYEREDPNVATLHHYYVVLRMEYYYSDISSGITIDYHVKGTMTMERKINTLIPDRDQAIQW